MAPNPFLFGKWSVECTTSSDRFEKKPVNKTEEFWRKARNLYWYRYAQNKEKR